VQPFKLLSQKKVNGFIMDEWLNERNAMTTDIARYWFRAKRYGLGWGLPLTWQGWVFLFSWMLILPLGIRFLTPDRSPMRWAFVAAMVVLLVVICYWKGEPSGRRWNSGDGT
jgi:hypothetical protein